MSGKKGFLQMRRILSIAWSLDRLSVVATVIKSILSGVQPYLTILLSAWVLDALAGHKPFAAILPVVLLTVTGIFALTVLEGVFDRLKKVHMELAVRKYEMKAAEKTLTMDYKLLESPVVSGIKTRMAHDNDWGAGFYSVYWQLDVLLSSLFSLAAAVVVMAPLFTAHVLGKSPAMPVYVAGIALLGAAASLFNTKYILKRQNECLLEGSTVSMTFYTLVSGGIDYKAGKDIRIFDAGKVIKEHIVEEYKPLFKTVKKYAALSGLGGLAEGGISGIMQAGAYLCVVLAAAAGAVSVGGMVKYAGTLYQFAASLSGFVMILGSFKVTMERQQSTLDYIDVPDVMYKGSLAVEKRNDREYEIEFRQVSFKYPGSDIYALKDFSLRFDISRRLAVVGMNGSGKTTMIKLLCRLYDPTEGEILLNGIDIKKYDYAQYMALFSVVFQDFQLFSLPMAQNVAAGVDYDETRVADAMDKVGLNAAHLGVNTPLFRDYDEAGVEISGGEAQKIALARALYKDAPFIILDEPTAALDPIAEYEIYSRFNEIVGDKTAIFISHRLSSCRFCDKIAVFHEGVLVQLGSHEQLLSDRLGKYCELWNAQAQYYTTTDE